MYEGYIVDYDPDTKLASVMMDGMRRIDDVPLTSPFTSGRGGSIRANPTLGDKCVLMGEPDDPKIIGFMGVYDPNSGSYSPREPKGTFGDISMGTAANNYIHLRRSGIIEIKASPLAQTVYIPLGGIIQEHFKQYRGQCPGGNISMGLKSVRTEDGGGAGAVLYSVNCRGSATDTDMSVSYNLGAVSDISHIPAAEIAQFSVPGPVYAQLAIGLGESAYLFQVLRTGERIEKTTQSKVTEVGGTEASLVGAVFKQVNGDVEMRVAGAVNMTCGADLIASITNSVRVSAPEIIFDGNVRLGGPDAVENVIKGAAFLQEYLTHTHNGTVPPPTFIGDIGALLSRKVFVK